jgi:hypothetical protein
MSASTLPLIPAKAGTQDKTAATQVSSLGVRGFFASNLLRPVLGPGLRRDERVIL